MTSTVGTNAQRSRLAATGDPAPLKRGHVGADVVRQVPQG